MTLKTYQQKRHFKKTPEPRGRPKASRGDLRFVVQKHDASRLHYDFRLEMDGVLKSWAVPKGPSLNPGDKRLAVEVEDHPLDYRTFEGTIPEGNYGAGTVIVWDEGTYHAPGVEGRKENESLLRHGLENGRLSFVLEGKKLNGEFSLVRMKRGKGNNWLLMKKRDRWADEADVTANDRSVTSGRRLTDVAGKSSAGPAKKRSVSSRSAGRVHRAKPEGNGTELTLTNLDKVYWPDEGYTKGDLIDYYREVAPVILPHLRDRPQSLHRYPNGIAGKSFFQKNIARQPPPGWVETVTIPSESTGRDVTYVVCQNEKTLLYLANLGCIELHPWNSRTQSLDRPDFLIIDLDPEDVPFSQVVEAAVVVHRLLDDAGVDSYCKTSGQSGLHVCVPLGARYSYDEVREVAEDLAKRAHERLPAITSLARSPSQRKRKVYLDFLQNSWGQTIAAPYSVRPWPRATVSAPLKWGEVTKRLDPGKFTIRTMPKRIEQVGDLWEPILARGEKLA